MLDHAGIGEEEAPDLAMSATGPTIPRIPVLTTRIEKLLLHRC
jgi:hypothetical protein